MSTEIGIGLVDSYQVRSALIHKCVYEYPNSINTRYRQWATKICRNLHLEPKWRKECATFVRAHEARLDQGSSMPFSWVSWDCSNLSMLQC